MSGALLMVLASGCFATMSAFVKGLAPTIPFAEVVMFRALLGLPPLVVIARHRGISLRPRRPGLMILRGLLGLLAMTCYFFALQRGLLANVTVIARFQPVLIALLSPLLLREQVPREALVALVVSVGGLLLVVRPAAMGLDEAAVAALAATLASALAHLIVRRLNATDDPVVIVTVFCAITALGGTGLAMPAFVWPGAVQWLLLVATAAFATAGQLLMTNAYRRDRAAVVAAASYTLVLYALAIGYLVWSEIPDPPALAGGAAIVAAGIYLVIARRSDEPPDPPP